MTSKTSKGGKKDLIREKLGEILESEVVLPKEKQQQIEDLLLDKDSFRVILVLFAALMGEDDYLFNLFLATLGSWKKCSIKVEIIPIGEHYDGPVH